MTEKNNAGCIEEAVRELFRRRDKSWHADISERYEWNVRIVMTDDIGFEFYVTEKIFCTLGEMNVPHEKQVETLTAFLFQLVEENISREIDVPKTKLLM